LSQGCAEDVLVPNFTETFGRCPAVGKVNFVAFLDDLALAEGLRGTLIGLVLVISFVEQLERTPLVDSVSARDAWLGGSRFGAFN
jgi:hypothetical protein